MPVYIDKLTPIDMAESNAETDRWLRGYIADMINDNFYVKDGYVYFLTDTDGVCNIEYETLFKQQYDLINAL